MNLSPPKLLKPLQRRARRGAAAAARSDAIDRDVDAGLAPTPGREPEDDLRDRAEAPEPGWRGSSYDLKHGLDVVELPTTLPVDVLDRLFNAPVK